MRIALPLLPLLLAASPVLRFAEGTALAASAVAVMPFKDLSGSRNAVGEALRETVTCDLKEVPGLKVIERATIDKVLIEQNLSAKRFDLNDIASVRVGTLVGASLMVTGAYQQASSNVRLTARFVKVETGEIVGTAKVDGRSADFLSLQDKVTVELLKSAGIEGKHVQKFAQRSRPKLKTMKTVELYGDAVVQLDDQKKVDLLRQSVAADSTFTYASHDLDELERRLKGYDAASTRAGRDAIADLKKRIQSESDPAKVAALQDDLFTQLLEQRRLRRLVTEARPVDSEAALLALLEAERRLFLADAWLRDGERFLQKYPRSKAYKEIREQMDEAIARRRRCETAVAEIAQAGLGSPPKDGVGRNDPCKISEAQDHACHYREARDQYLACLKTNPRREDLILVRLVWMHVKLGDYKAAEKSLKDLEKSGSHWYGSLIGGLEHADAYPFPVDD